MQKGILIFLISCFIFLSAFLFFKKNKNQDYGSNKYIANVASKTKNNNDKVDNVKTKKVKVKEKITYSRISFFNTQPVYASLAIPSNWEGKYRMREKGNTVLFLYINNGKSNNIIFSIKLLKHSDDNKAFISKYGYDFVLLKNLDNDSVGGELRDMRNNVDKILNSIKIFKIK